MQSASIRSRLLVAFTALSLVVIVIGANLTYSVVKNDSEKSFEMLKSNGIILWHDYVPGKRSSSDVVKYINSILDKKKIYKIKNTSLCFYKNS